MLIAISGSQGSGKSTVVNGLRERGYHTLDRKVARSILEEWGVSLEEVNDNHDLTIDFQDAITARKRDDERMAALHKDVYITERTHADVFTYALIDLGRDNSFSEWVDNYYNVCLEHNQYYERVYYLKGGLFTVEHDGVRGSNKHYSRMVDSIMLDVTKQMIHPSRLTIIDVPDLKQRINIIDKQCRML